MKKSRNLYAIALLIFIGLGFNSCGQNQFTDSTSTSTSISTKSTKMTTENTNWNPLTPEEARVIEDKGTESPFFRRVCQ